MKRALVLFLGLLIFCVSCSCGTYVAHVPNKGTVDSSFSQEYKSRGQRRLVNKKLTGYMKARTVSVRNDCSPKESVVVVVGSGVSPERRHDGRGTGIIVRSYGDKSYIFTAAHVVLIGNHQERQWFRCKITVQLPEDAAGNSNKIKAKILVSDEGRDLAVLEVDKDLGLQTELELDPFTGEDVWAVGYPVQKASPRSILLSITKGTLATKNVPVFGNASSNGYFHRITSQVYFGNSGGGIWTKEGKLLGVVVVLYAAAQKVPYEGYYYAKPINEVLNLLLRRHKYNEVFRK